MAANLEHFVRGFRWTSLVQVAIEGVIVNENVLRHQDSTSEMPSQ